MSLELPYARLDPELIIEAVESVGFECDGRMLALASYENRVYQIGVGEEFIVAKFYRPGRWSDEAILEEHRFSLELADHDIPVVPPLIIEGESLREHAGYRFALFERRGGRWPELATADDRIYMGRVLGRLHAVGAIETFQHRTTLSIEWLGRESVSMLETSGLIPPHLVESYHSIAADVLDAVERQFAAAGRYVEIRIHGDCHPGNVLWTDAGLHFVDLDDCMNGPAVQDLWLFLSGSRDEMSGQLAV